MNDVQRAAAYSTFKIVFIALACGTVIPLIFYVFPLEYLGIGIVTFMLYFFIKLVYTMEVDRLTRERNEAILKDQGND